MGRGIKRIFFQEDTPVANRYIKRYTASLNAVVWTTWMGLEGIVLNEMSQTKKDKHYVV